MMRPLSPRWLIPLVLVVLLLPACSDSSDDAADTTLAPTTTEATTTEATTTTIAVTTTTAAPPTTSTTTTTQPTMTTAAASAGPLDNGGFESGDLTAWSTQSWGAGEWLVYSDGSTPPDPSITDQHNAFDVPDPPEGDFAAVTDMDSAGLRFLYRDIVVAGSPMLHVVVFYENHGLEIHVQPTFGTIDGDKWNYSGTSLNQQYRVDLIDPQAPIESLEADDVLATVFRTVSGDPTALEPTPVSIDLSPWEGQTIRLRATQVDNMGAMRAGIDDVRLERTD